MHEKNYEEETEAFSSISLENRHLANHLFHLLLHCSKIPFLHRFDKKQFSETEHAHVSWFVNDDERGK